MLSWREVEVELVDGKRKVLERVGKRLVEAGARRTARPSKVAEVVGEQARGPAGPLPCEGPGAAPPPAPARHPGQELRTRDPLVRERLPEGVHTMRVAIRRLRSLLATGRPFLTRSVTDPLRDELAWLADALGEVRDAEVRPSRLDESVDNLVEERPEVDWEAEQVRSALWSPLVEQHERALAALTTRCRATGTSCCSTGSVGSSPTRPGATRRPSGFAGAYLRRTQHELDRVDRRMEAALDPDHTPDERARALHEARKATKRARYAVEPLRPVYGARPQAHQAVEETAVSPGSAPGHRGDPWVSPRPLAGHGPSLDPAAVLTAGALIERESRAAEGYDARAASAWRKVEKDHLI